MELEADRPGIAEIIERSKQDNYNNFFLQNSISDADLIYFLL